MRPLMLLAWCIAAKVLAARRPSGKRGEVALLLCGGRYATSRESLQGASHFLARKMVHDGGDRAECTGDKTRNWNSRISERDERERGCAVEEDPGAGVAEHMQRALDANPARKAI